MKSNVKKWTPPKAQEVYTESLRPSEKVKIRDYKRNGGDMFILIAEFPIAALSRKATWEETIRVARNIVKMHLICSIIIEFFPKDKKQLYDRVRIFDKYNFADWPKSENKSQA